MDFPDGALFSRVSSSGISLVSCGHASPRQGSFKNKQIPESANTKDHCNQLDESKYNQDMPIKRESVGLLGNFFRKSGAYDKRKTLDESDSETGFTLRPKIKQTSSLGNFSSDKYSQTRTPNGNYDYIEIYTKRPLSDTCTARVVPCRADTHEGFDQSHSVNAGECGDNKQCPSDCGKSLSESFQRKPRPVTSMESNSLLSPVVTGIFFNNSSEKLSIGRSFTDLRTDLESHSDRNSRNSMFFVSDNDIIDTPMDNFVKHSPRLYPRLSTADDCEAVSQRSGLDHVDSEAKGCTPYHEQPTEEKFDDSMLDRPKKVKYRKLKTSCRLLLPIISLVIYVWDIGSDIKLAITYKEHGDVDLFFITLACIVIPLVLMSVVDVSWVWIDSSSCSTRSIVRYLLGALTLGRILRAIIYMWFIVKSETAPTKREKVWYRKRAMEEKRDCFMLDFINAFAESAPQLFVQMYLMYAFRLELTTIRVLNILSSWISIAWTYGAHYRCNREALAGRQDVNAIGFVTFFLAALSALAARVMCIVLFLVYFKLWIGATVLTVHVIVMFLWIFLRERPTFEGTTSSACGRFLYCVFFSYVSLLCFVNLQATKARYRMTLFYVILYIENFTLAGFTLHRLLNSEIESDTAFNLLALPVGLLCHVTLLLVYYQGFHPKTGKCFKTDMYNNADDVIGDL